MSANTRCGEGGDDDVDVHHIRLGQFPCKFYRKVKTVNADDEKRIEYSFKGHAAS